MGCKEEASFIGTGSADGQFIYFFSFSFSSVCTARWSRSRREKEGEKVEG